jgi:hypothetical protein
VTNAAATATAITGLVAGLLGVLRYFDYKTKKDRLAAVGDAFAEVVHGLNAPDEIERLAHAILLRRFFDPRSEFTVRGLVHRKMPYANAAVDVIAATLRTAPTGNMQKLLADGLAYAPSLVDVDLQRTNVRYAYLGVKDAAGRPSAERTLPSMERTDFFRADLTGASFRRADLRRAVFYEANLTDVVLTGADLRAANFRCADLAGVRLDGALLDGADFSDARHVPPGISDHLDDGKFTCPPHERFVPPVREPSPMTAPVVFLSSPSVVDASHRAVQELIVGALRDRGASVKRIERHEYSPSSPFGLVVSTMRECWGVVVVGLGQLQVKEACLRPGTAEQQVIRDLSLPTPWNQIEAGMAVALGLPLLVVSDCAKDGIFYLGGQGDDVRAIELDDGWDVAEIQRVVGDWTRSLRSPAPVASTRL